MTESELYGLTNNNIYVIRIIDNIVSVSPCEIKEIIKRSIYSNKSHIDTFRVDIELPETQGYLRETMNLDRLFLTEAEAKVGLNAYIATKIIEMETIKSKLLSCKIEFMKC